MFRRFVSRYGLRIFLNMPIFLNRKIKEIKKMTTEKEMLDELRRGRVLLPPLSLRFVEGQPQSEENRSLDASVEVSWLYNTAKFAIECKALSTPKAFQEALSRLKFSPLMEDQQPMLFVPFLSEEQLQILEQEGISGIDLCGNGLVIVQGAFAVFRSGQKNRFPSSAPIRNIYRKNTSMVARIFLVHPAYNSVQEICSEINRRNLLVNRWDKTPMSLSTISKSLKTLEEDLIVERTRAIRLLQPEALLEKLSLNYIPPIVKRRVRLKVQVGNGSLQDLFVKHSRELNLPLMATGMSSTERFAVMQRGDLLSVYCPAADLLLDRVPGDQSDRFPNLELVETDDERVYFDARPEGGFWWASPVQVYLELMAGDKRDQETAEQVKQLILTKVQEAQP